MDPHYPSTSELAAFRRSIAPEPDAFALDVFRTFGAWPDERKHGIGRRDATIRYSGHGRTMRLAASTGEHASIARREASAMRSRAYARGLEASYVDWMRLCVAVETFEPRPAGDWPAL